MRSSHVAVVVGALLALAPVAARAQDPAGHSGRVAWRTDVAQALADAQTQGKPVWILASASW